MNGETFVIYTTEVGGQFKTAHASEDQYQDAVSSGQWDETPVDEVIPRGTRLVDLKMIALLRVERNHDFVLGHSREPKPIAA